MSYAKKGSLRKCLSDINKFNWLNKLQLLKKIILGLKVIHESNLIHSDLHDGNILMSDNHNELFIIDLGLCKPISNLQDSDKKNNEICGVLPYMAPEILRHKPYTSASDIYSFSMIMWEFTSGIPPFNNRAHDLQLTIDICKGDHPKISENTPKCYVDLMKKCWDLNPSKRPIVTELEYKISEWIRCIGEYYEVNKDGKYKYEVFNVDNNLKNDMLEFVKANNTLAQEHANIFTIVQSHPQACYKSHLLKKINDSLDQDEKIIVSSKSNCISLKSECSDCKITKK
jgi:serine/threonine protein kinase